LPYSIDFRRSVARDLRRLDKSEADRLLTRLADELPERAASCPELTAKLAGLRELRVGEYRVIFAIVGNVVLVTRIAHRRDVYRT
jgi:mRNA-degrading endonuclease RelE of RelBE toxin-antitoxin system